MAYEFHAEVELEVPVERAWAVLTDFAAYPEWNPFTRSVRCSGEVGSKVVMDVRFARRRAVRQVETLRAFTPPSRIVWALDQAPRWLLWAERAQTLEPLGPDRSRYVTVDTIGGALGFVVNALYGADLRDGFAAMASALQTRVGVPEPHDRVAPGGAR